ncbi:MAG: DUF3810 domain-containing protein, partial [Bacillota bacterium]|nr:DUF3810 domain-containing protein [Bacillota bacterium]
IRVRVFESIPEVIAVKQKTKIQSILSRPSWYLWLVPLSAAFLAQRVLITHPELVERVHARTLFRWLSIPISRITSLFPFSLTEASVILGIPLALILLITWIVRLIKRPEKALRFARLARATAWTLSVAYLMFMLLHGLNYARLPVGQSFDLPVRERTSDELQETAAWLVEQTNRIRSLSEEDERGVFVLSLGIDDTLKTASAAYDAASVDYPLLAGPPIRPKGVLLSHYWSYTGITGVYMPFFVESNVNIDVPEHSIPETALHEIAHTRGFAREDEAGFLAFLTGIYSDNPDFAYSVLLGAALRSLNALGGIDAEGYQAVASQLSDAVRRDLQATGVYWKQFEGPVQEASTKVNDAYLQANLQEDGVRSYGRMVDLVLTWYEQQSERGTLGASIAADRPAS